MTDIKPKAAALLQRHIAEQQTSASKLQALLEVVTRLENEGACSSGRAVIVELCLDMAQSLNNRLDSVNLPEVA